jgi:hypothetical protein
VENGFVLDEAQLRCEEEYFERRLSMGREEISTTQLESIRREQRKLLEERREIENWYKEFERYLEYIKTKVYLALR